MKLETAREKQLDAYLQDGNAKDPQQVRIVLKGQAQFLAVYRIPIKYLMYNIRNGRFAAELLDREAQLKRKLDPAGLEDTKEIQRLLIELNPSQTRALREDLSRNGQLDPGIITHDGAVINGNRRMAILTSLYEETSDPKFEYLRAARLPKAVDEKDLWRLEAGLQFAKEFRLDYSPINELLKLKEGHDSGLSDGDISQTLLGRFTKQEVKEKLEILKLVESYLHFIEKPGQYHLVQEERNIEKFNSLYASVIAPLRRKGTKESDIANLITFGFQLIKQTDLTHWDIRFLSKIAADQPASEELFKRYDPNDTAKPNKEDLEETYTTAREMVELRQQRAKPERLIRKAISALRSVQPSSSNLSAPAIRSLLTELNREVSRLRKAAGIQ